MFSFFFFIVTLFVFRFFPLNYDWPWAYLRMRLLVLHICLPGGGLACVVSGVTLMVWLMHLSGGGRNNLE